DRVPDRPGGDVSEVHARSVRSTALALERLALRANGLARVEEAAGTKHDTLLAGQAFDHGDALRSPGAGFHRLALDLDLAIDDEDIGAPVVAEDRGFGKHRRFLRTGNDLD